MTITMGVVIFVAGTSFGCLLALCAVGFARANGAYDRALNGLT
jgi:hypothetical protein